MQNLLMMSSTYITLNNKRVSPYNTILGSKESLILKPISTPSSTLISTIQIIWSCIIIVNMLKLLIFKSIGWMIQQSWRCPYYPHLPYIRIRVQLHLYSCIRFSAYLVLNMSSKACQMLLMYRSMHACNHNQCSLHFDYLKIAWSHVWPCTQIIRASPSLQITYFMF